MPSSGGKSRGMSLEPNSSSWPLLGLPHTGCRAKYRGMGVGSKTTTSLGSSASELVTLVVTTSPIPSHPSLVLLRTLLNSFRKHLVDFENYNLLLVCDGFSRSDGKDQLCSKEAYQQFLDSVQELCASGELGNCQILELKSCHGYGLALSAALAEVVTEFVFVVQHDWLLVKDVDLGPVVNAMDLDATIKYVGLQSLTTLDYARRMQLRYNLQLPPDRHLCGLRLVPQLLWYDKPHLTRKKHYLEVVLPEAKMGVFQNPERRYGVDQMWPKLLHAENLEEEHLRHGTFFWDVGAEVVYHLSGRKLLAVDEDAETERPEGLYGVATATATFTSVAADRTMYIAGLALPKAKGQSGRFKGRCYVCGERGHSKSNCSMTGLERKPEAVAGLCAESIKPPH
ncbi:unnamed protein product [Cladocopium goreaui]|uniref:C3H1-type domain-containing protein n=1 Tax=Cladocopium goreaui TaxID=2562237 RepID=A0A9P1GAG4_9DINO|nr:unnamed protein product [Cladocopium goreaui]